MYEQQLQLQYFTPQCKDQDSRALFLTNCQLKSSLFQLERSPRDWGKTKKNKCKRARVVSQIRSIQVPQTLRSRLNNGPCHQPPRERQDHCSAAFFLASLVPRYLLIGRMPRPPVAHVCTVEHRIKVGGFINFELVCRSNTWVSRLLLLLLPLPPDFARRDALRDFSSPETSSCT